MSDYLGDFAAGSTVRVPWNTNAAAGESNTRGTDGSIRVYKNASTTERTSSNGITDLEDHDNNTGTHLVSIDLSDNTDAGFYAAGNDYGVKLVGAAIDGKTVNRWIAWFSVENRSHLRPTVAGRTLDVSATGEAGVDWANVGSPTTSQTLSGTTIGTTTTLTNAPSDSAGVTTLLTRLPAGLFTGLTNFAQWLGALAGKQTANSTARTEIRATGAGSGTFDETTDSQEAIRDNMGTAQSGDAYARIGTNGAGLTTVPWNSAWDTEVQSEVQDAIEVNHLDHLLAVDYDPASKPGVSTALLNELVENDGGVSRFTANALEQAPTGGGGSAPTVEEIRQEMDANSTQLAKLGTPATSISADIAAVKSDSAAIKLKTDNLPSDPADASDIAAATNALNTKLGSPAGASVSADIAAVKSDTAAIKLKTDGLPSDPADASDLSALFDALPTAAENATAVWANGTRTLSKGSGVKKNTALNNFHFKLVDSAGDPVLGATVTATRMIDNGAFSACANSASEASGGWYRINLANTDVNGDVVTFSFAAAGALTREITIVTEP